MAMLYRLRLAGPSGNMGFGCGKQRNKHEPNLKLCQIIGRVHIPAESIHMAGRVYRHFITKPTNFD